MTNKRKKVKKDTYQICFKINNQAINQFESSDFKDAFREFFVYLMSQKLIVTDEPSCHNDGM